MDLYRDDDEFGAHIWRQVCMEALAEAIGLEDGEWTEVQFPSKMTPSRHAGVAMHASSSSFHPHLTLTELGRAISLLLQNLQAAWL